MNRPPTYRPLTSHEWAVIELIGSGKRPKEIAAHLNIKPSSVKSYMQRISLKLPGPPLEPRARIALWYHSKAA